MQKWKANPEYFQDKSIAALLFDQSLFNGFGQYLICELLHRLMTKCNVTPNMTAFDCFSNPTILCTLISAPLLLFEELQPFQSHFDPAIFGPTQQQTLDFTF